MIPKHFNALKTSKTLEGAQCDLILVEKVFIIPNQQDPYILKHINASNNQFILPSSCIAVEVLSKITEIKDKQQNIQLRMLVKIDEINKLQQEACELDRENNQLENSRRELEQKERDNWIPDIYLKGVVLQEEASKHKFKAATVAKRSNNNILFKGLQICTVFNVQNDESENPNLITFNKYY